MREKRVPPGMMPFGPGPGRHHPGGPVQKAADTRGVLRRLWGYLRPYALQLVGVSLLVVATTALSLLHPYLTSRAVDDGIVPGNLHALARVAGWMLLVHVLAAAGTYVQSIAMIRISQGTVRDLRRDLFTRIQALPLRFFDRNPHGELMSRLTNDTEAVSQTLAQSVTRLVSSTLSVIGAAYAMFALNVRLAVAALITLPLMLVASRAIARATREGFRERQSCLGAVNAIVEEMTTGQRVVKLCRHEHQAIAQFDEANAALRRAGIKAGIWVGLMGPVMGLFRNAGFAILAAAGGWMVLRDWATLGIVAAFIAYAQHFSRPLNEIAMIYGTIQSAVAGAERVFAILDEAPERDAPERERELADVRGEVVFDRVSFSYVEGQPILKDVSFCALPGQTIALVGPTGAGKTTIINLLTRFYDIDSGSIRVDGYDIRDVTRESLRRSLGIVLQDTFLFADTVRENIRYGRLDATDEEVEEAARLANAEGFIRRLPQGFDTPLSEAAGTLSQGQRQLLAIARAILADPAILILDEATSSVDTRTELQIQEGMLRLMDGRTSFVIAHRLSTIRQADCILVFDGGRVVERGTHEELLAAGGAYYALYSSQYQLSAKPLRTAESAPA
ncbi:MAG TPA: ABC transporter ATP-binding protein [Armatimonadota bacterium]|nr:ABC transporter ATP-binding protein [Armatimonadota bacterium]